MERLDGSDDVARYWAALRSQLTSQLPSWVRIFFRDLAPAEAETIGALIGEGKKLRGSVVLAVCDALGGSLSKAMPAAVAIECIHAASLMHDDFVDSDCTRRDGPAAWIVHGSRRAVLLADVIFATALQRTAELGQDEVLTLAGAIAKVAAGAYREPLDATDMDVAAREPPGAPSLYDRIIHLKTGALFAAAAEIGAIAANASPALRKAASAFGALAGEAYQMADDLNDVVAHAASPLLSPQAQATLAILLMCFGLRRDGEAADQAVLGPRSIEKLVSALDTAIGTRISRAHEALEPFGRRAAKLQMFPRMIVEPILASAERAPRAIFSPR